MNLECSRKRTRVVLSVLLHYDALTKLAKYGDFIHAQDEFLLLVGAERGSEIDGALSSLRPNCMPEMV